MPVDSSNVRHRTVAHTSSELSLNPTWPEDLLVGAMISDSNSQHRNQSLSPNLVSCADEQVEESELDFQVVDGIFADLVRFK